ncbi:Tam3-transposase (Ac family) protein [Dioscorea alata]|uniref:Tam3-transposase (Ac family) protein n=1 Tax=Dioscorea alata TaxID=55571 RepID=A0ACB7VIN7_DIOAL|nr:Tam3-transposase (Ac family) protein [Dioscorea alata]
MGTHHIRHHSRTCTRRHVMDIRQRILTKDVMSKDLKSQSFDQDVARNRLASMITIHYYPLSMVDHHAFQEFCCSLQPLFKCPTRNTIKSDILKLYKLVRAKAIKFFEKNESRIALTTNRWTSSNQKNGFMVVIAHFIDNSWILQSQLLRFMYVPCPHTSQVLAQALVKNKLEENHLTLSGCFLHIRCCAHILNIIVKYGLDVIKNGIEKIRDSVLYWSATPKSVEKFEETEKQLKFSNIKNFILDYPTRWNSTYMMLETTIVYKDVFFHLRRRESQYKCLPNETDWEFVKKICEKLKMFYTTTEIFSGTKYPTADLFFRKVCQIKIALNLCYLDDVDVIISKMAMLMMEKYDKYWGCNPRHKFDKIEFYFSKIFGSEYDDKVEKIQDILLKLLKAYDTSKDKSTTESNVSSKETNANLDEEEFLAFWKRRKNVKVTMMTELDHYLEDDVVIDSKTDFDVLVWWKVNGMKFPTLQAIVRDILAIPISTVASEPAFSMSGMKSSSAKYH